MQNTVITATNEPAILIEPSDLRIGNALYYKGNPVSVTLLSLDIDDEYQETIGFCKLGENSNEISDWNRALCGDLQPIALTPEILEKCGFEQNMGGWYLEGNVYQESFNTDDRTFGWCMELCDVQDSDVHFRLGYGAILINDAPARHVKYLHQLQNLFFALTGEELVVDF